MKFKINNLSLVLFYCLKNLHTSCTCHALTVGTSFCCMHEWLLLFFLKSFQVMNIQTCRFFVTQNLILACKVKTVYVLLSGTVCTSLQTLKRSFTN